MKTLLLAACIALGPGGPPGAACVPQPANPAPHSIDDSVARVDTLAVRRATLRSPPPLTLRQLGLVPEGAGRGHDPFDLAVATRLRDSAMQENGTAQAIAGVFRFVSIPGTVLLAGALYGVGEAGGRDDLSDLGLQTGQAIVLAGATTLVGKVAIGRARPHESPVDPYDVELGRGFRGDRYQSFPSAHTAAAFATASVLASELTERHPGSGEWIYPSAYGAAAMAGLSRLFHEEHWATDIVAGALIGVLSGWVVVEYHGGSAN